VSVCLSFFRVDLKQRLAHEALDGGTALHHVLQQIAPETAALIRRDLVPARTLSPSAAGEVRTAHVSWYWGRRHQGSGERARARLPVAEGGLFEHDGRVEARVVVLRVGNDKVRHLDGILGPAQPDDIALGLGPLRADPCAAQLTRSLDLFEKLRRGLRHLAGLPPRRL